VKQAYNADSGGREKKTHRENQNREKIFLPENLKSDRDGEQPC